MRKMLNFHAWTTPPLRRTLKSNQKTYLVWVVLQVARPQCLGELRVVFQDHGFPVQGDGKCAPVVPALAPEVGEVVEQDGHLRVFDEVQGLPRVAPRREDDLLRWAMVRKIHQA